MLPLTYFLKVILCSAAFFGYYLIALRNRKIHQFNRAYLLFSVIASWLIPFLKFEIAPDQKIRQPVYRAVTFIAESNSKFEIEPAQFIAPVFNWMQLLLVIYFLMAGFILIALVHSLFNIYQIYKKYPKQKMRNIVLVNTAEYGTPFSFFKYIFWNNEIDIGSIPGKQILQHELTHVKEKHSWDKVFTQIILIPGWFNPFFWLIKKELGMIHEFIADNNAITNSSAADLASMLLLSAFPSSKYTLTNPFFYSPIKRRLIMLTENKKPRFSYLKKLIVLPLLAIVVMLFAFRPKENTTSNSMALKTGIKSSDQVKLSNTPNIAGDYNLSPKKILNAPLSKKYRIVVDAGHGGADFGCNSVDESVYEKEVNLKIVKAIKELNINTNIEIILTRDNDHFDDLKTKAAFINSQKADLCISIHCNDAGKNELENGTEIYVVKQGKNNDIINESNALAQSVNGILKENFASRGIKANKQGIWILHAAQCPAILIEAGFLSNKNDAAMLAKTDSQELIANNILKGIENYLTLKEK